MNNYSNVSIVMSKVTIIRNAEACEVTCINPDKVRSLAGALPKNEVLTWLSDIFQMMSDPTRLKILYCLSREEVCVCDLSNLLGMTVSAVSHQLRLLRTLRLVKSRRVGRMVYYSLAGEHAAKLLTTGLEHWRE